MSKETITSIIEIADIHEQRIKQALDIIAPKLPLTSATVTSCSDYELMAIELLTSRFSKLQDYLGTKVFNLFFEATSENIDDLTLIDKLNRLEKYGIIEDAHLWQVIRKSRNFLAHEYPNEPEITAISLNRIISLIPELLAVKHRLITKIQSV